MGHYSGKDFDADKTVQCSKLWNEMPKKYVGFDPTETPTQELIYRFQRGRDLRGKWN